MDIGLIAFNDFHGNLEPPHIAIPIRSQRGVERVPAGGAAYLASAIAQLKARHPHHAVITAGDMVSASPLVSALFLDEPTIEAVNHMQIDFSAVGNHEFDRGWQELLRLQQGGCEKFTVREPCQISKPFEGAKFRFLAANTVREDGQPLLPATGIKRFTQGDATVAVGFIGMTLKATPTMVSPAGVKGLRFEDEAATANALVPQLRAQERGCDRGRHPRRGLHRCRRCWSRNARASTATSCRFWSGWALCGCGRLRPHPPGLCV